MKRRSEPQGRWLRRLFRGRCLDRNPLRRTSDRAETLILAGVMTAFLAGAPVAAFAGGSFTHDVAQQLRQSQLATRSQVTAVTTQAVPSGQSRNTGFSSPTTEARWVAPDGKVVYGEVPATFGAPAGTTVQVWTTASGKLADPPLREAQVADLRTLGQVVSVIALAVVLTLAWTLARQELDRRRYAAWDADWQATDSHGTQRK